MIRFNAALFYLHSTWLDRFDVLIRDAPSPKTYLEESRDEFLDSLGIFKDSLRETGLTISLISLDRLSEAIAIGEPSRVRDCAHGCVTDPSCAIDEKRRIWTLQPYRV